MQFGLTNNSDKAINIQDLQKALKTKKAKCPNMDTIRIFCEVCMEIANVNKMNAVIHLEEILDFEKGAVEAMNVKFKKW